MVEKIATDVILGGVLGFFWSCCQFGDSLSSILLWTNEQGKDKRSTQFDCQDHLGKDKSPFVWSQGSVLALGMIFLHTGTGTRWWWGGHATRVQFWGCCLMPGDHRAPNDETYFLSPAVIPSWIWELFPQMVDSLRKIFKHSNLPQRRSPRETCFCKVFAAVFSSSQRNP